MPVGSAITSLTGNRPYRKTLLRLFNLEFEQAPLKQRQALLESNLPRDRWRTEPPQTVVGQGRLRWSALPLALLLPPGRSFPFGRSWLGTVGLCCWQTTGGPPVSCLQKLRGAGGAEPPELAVAPDFAPVFGQSCRFTGYHRLSQQVPVLSTTYESSVLSACSSTTCKWESVSACSFNNLQA